MPGLARHGNAPRLRSSSLQIGRLYIFVVLAVWRDCHYCQWSDGTLQTRRFRVTTQAFRARWRLWRTNLLFFELHRNFAGADCTMQSFVVPFVLVGVVHGKLSDRTIERITVPHISTKDRWRSRTRVAKREGFAAPLRKEIELIFSKCFHTGSDLDVAKLAHEEVSCLAARPPKKHIAGRLHHAITIHHALSVIRTDALACVLFEDRCACFLDLKKQRIFFSRHEKNHPAGGADAADADHFNRGVVNRISIEQRLVGVGKCIAITPESTLDNLADSSRRV